MNERTFARTLSVMFRNIKSGSNIYIVFSKKSFHILIFTLAMSIIANTVLIYLMLNYPAITGGIFTGGIRSIIIFACQLILSVAAVISGIWLVFKGIDIVTDDS